MYINKLIELSQSALILARELKKPLSESNALGAQALAYKELGEQDKAITILEDV
ncbi:hypothetical protein DSM106972_081110 [Dulcicalothrix desertica PCC 7102]|uniref:MalT-like TPR region domain-containing protein n=1 Tax=Dulcicalothrix desertica PCC 7102 TaxID=232991 RepID=A0A3S1C1E1_9CYAN|nr:hypothetical protein [Dulcicalothrix desertica]RUS98482.1 hypothetical protein DSM106972_081110 [Dulcicalothrix desertica PCC 7102]